MKKKLPIGIDDFKELRIKDYYFFDKTMLIDEILSNKYKVTLLPRPRRFGKTLSVSMLKYFFDVKSKEENRKLFENLEISKTDKMKYQGEYPVIHITLKDIKAGNWKDCFRLTKSLISDLYNNNKYVLENLKGTDKENFENILWKKENAEYDKSLLELCKYLNEYYNKKVILLIDEYDAPLITAHTQGYYDEAIIFFRNFFSSALKENPYLELSLMTGILRIAKESIFSGLNNLAVLTILNNQYNHFGVKEEEVEKALKDYNLSYEMKDVKKWYNGYKFGENLVYNPWSIINFLSADKLAPYWVNTSENTLIKNMLNSDNERILNSLEKIFVGETFLSFIKEDIVFDKLYQSNNFWSLMFFSGYLTFEEVVLDELTEEISYSLRIPNKEVKTFFRRSFIEINSYGENQIYSEMITNLYKGNIETFKNIFKDIYFNAVSYHDTGYDEKYYHHFMLGLLLILGERYKVISNREVGLGRCDIALEPKDKKDYGLIFEFKIGTSENIEEKAQEALIQIEEKKYDANMKFNGITKVIKIGMAFAGKNVCIKSKID